MKEGKIGNCKEGLDAYTAVNKILERIKGKELDGIDVCCISDKSKAKSTCISGEDTEDKRNKLCGLLSVG